MTTPDLFKLDYSNAIKVYLRSAVKDGTVSLGADCLFQCVRVPEQHAPRGTNARWLVRQIFNEITNNQENIRCI